MSTYVITGSVDTVALRTKSDGTWKGSVMIPAFRLNADSREAAGRLAQAIIDPLEMTTAHVTVTAAEDSEDCPACNSDKLTGVFMTLYSLTGEVGDMLGIDTGSLLNDEGDEEDDD
jgi:hypothetical protein